MSVTVYGSSDDLIEVEGAIREEFTLHNEEDGDLLAFSNGVVLRVRYSEAGVWRISPVTGVTMAVTIDPAPEHDDDNYSDRAVIDGEVWWVVHGTDWGKA